MVVGNASSRDWHRAMAGRYPSLGQCWGGCRSGELGRSVDGAAPRGLAASEAGSRQLADLGGGGRECTGQQSANGLAVRKSRGCHQERGSPGVAPGCGRWLAGASRCVPVYAEGFAIPADADRRERRGRDDENHYDDASSRLGACSLPAEVFASVNAFQAPQGKWIKAEFTMDGGVVHLVLCGGLPT